MGVLSTIKKRFVWRTPKPTYDGAYWYKDGRREGIETGTNFMILNSLAPLMSAFSSDDLAEILFILREARDTVRKQFIKEIPVEEMDNWAAQ